MYGISTACLKGMSLEHALALSAEAGFRQVELLCSETPVGQWYLDPAGTRRALKGAGMTAPSVHSHPKGWNSADPDAAARRLSVDRAAECFGPSAEIGTEVVIVHSNNSGHKGDYTDQRHETSRQLSVDSLGVLAERAASAGIKMAVENLPARGLRRPGTTVADLLRMIDGMGDHVGVCLDAGHANSNGLSAADEARLAAGKALAAHLQDNDGLGEDQHLVPGAGSTDWPAFLAALDGSAPDCVCTFEVGAEDGAQSRDVLMALAEIRDRWERMG